MADLGEAGRELVAHPVRTPKPLDDLRRRSAARHHRHRRLAASGMVLCLVAAIVVGVAIRHGNGTAAGRVNVVAPPSTTSTTPAPEPRRPTVRPGERRIDFGDASLVVPGSWVVVPPGQSTCSESNTVFLGTPGAAPACPAQLPPSRPSTIVGINVLSKGSRSSTGILFGRHWGNAIGTTSAIAGGRSYAFSDLGVDVTVAGPDGHHILGTIDWSDRHLALAYAAQRAGDRPAGWKTVSTHNVTLRVPSTWPLERLGKRDPMPNACSEVHLRAAAVVTGLGTPPTFSCDPDVGRKPALAVDGVWARLAYNTLDEELKQRPSPVRLLRQVDNTSIYLDSSGDPDGTLPVLHLVVRMTAMGLTTSPDQVIFNRGDTAIDVGLGGDPTIAGEIIASIRTN